jgi:hypothetical protein
VRRQHARSSAPQDIGSRRIRRIDRREREHRLWPDSCLGGMEPRKHAASIRGRASAKSNNPGTSTMRYLVRYLAGLLACCVLAACGNAGNGPGEEAQNGAPPVGLANQSPLIFKDGRMVIWGVGVRAVPPVVPGSLLSASLFESSAPDLVSVESDGSVKSHRTGTAQLRSKNGSVLQVVVHTLVGLALEPATVNLTSGGEATLLATVAGEKIPASDVEWLTDAPDVASVDRGRIVGGRSGTATISIRAGTALATARVKVSAPSNAQAIVLAGPSNPVQKGTVFQLYPRSLPPGPIHWTSSIPSVVAPLSGGIFQAVAVGHAEACISTQTARGCASIVVR